MTTSGAPARFRLHRNPLIDGTARWALLRRSRGFLQLRSLLTKEKHLGAGTVSIIVPFYNTERYLEAALDSIRLQRYWDLEIILVDDRSSDDSVRIAESFVTRDNRFRLIRTAGLGPGGARNAGLTLATGRYLAFVDGDDILPVGAIARLVESLRLSGSSFAVGAFEHLRGNEKWRSAWVHREHERTLTQCSLADVPGITRNVFPWNKLFVREFFMRSVRSFPEGTLYEDQVPTALAFVNAKSFDVLGDTVYLWRQRESGDSITQNRSTDDHLAQRLEVLKDVGTVYSNHSPTAVYRDWLKKSLNEDLMPFVEASEEASNEYRDCLAQAAIALWNQLDTQERSASLLHFNAPVMMAVMDQNYEKAWRLLSERS